MLPLLRRPLRRGRRAGLASVALAVVLLPASSHAASLGGKVRAMSDDQPIGQFTVELYSATMTKLGSTCTSALGDYAFTNLAPAVYNVSFSGDTTTCAASGFAPSWWEGRGVSKFADPVDLTGGGSRTDINGRPQAEATISGTVKDAVTKAAIANVSVRVIDTDQQEVRRTCTDGFGNYLASRLPGGVFGVQFVSDGTCGPVTAYASQFYESGATFAQAKAVLLGYGESATGKSVELSMPAPPTPTPTPVPDPTPAPTATPKPSPSPAPTPAPAPGAAPTPTPKPTGAAAPTPTMTPKPGATPAPTSSPSGPGGTDGPGSGPTPVATQKPACTLKTTGKVSRGAFSVSVTCDREAKLVLGGTLTFRRGAKTTTVKLATVAATSSKTMLKVNVPAKAATARKAKLKVSGSLKLTASTTAGSTTKSLTVARLK